MSSPQTPDGSSRQWEHAPDYGKRYASERAAVKRAWKNRRRGSLGWGVGLISLMVAMVFQYLTWSWRGNAREVYILDSGGNIYFGAKHEFSSGLELFNLLATDATMAFFQRSASRDGSLDRTDLAQRIYRKQAYQLLMEDLQRQKPDLQVRALHQKVEIGRIRQLEEKKGSIYVLTEGQLVRAGHLKGLPISESEPFSLILKFTRNLSMTPGASPWVVEEWARQLPESY